jgi:malonate-semialdehyde dehydrogenase (acetylating)/methylmalonate-semialdehyde dehydrogenase
VDGAFVKSSTTSHHFVKNPATHELIGKVPETTQSEVDAAIQVAKEAYEEWRWVPVQQRQRVMLHYQQLIRDATDDLAYWITLENGKTLADARGDVFRGLEVVETACNVADKLLGESLAGISRNMDCVSYKQPLGVCAGVGTFQNKKNSGCFT